MRLLLLSLLLATTCGLAAAGDYGRKNRHLKRPVPLERQSYNHQPVPTLSLDQASACCSWGGVWQLGKQHACGRNR